jgi:CRISPR-associated protein Csd1
MSWIQRLYETYPNCVKVALAVNVVPPWPIAHLIKRAQVEVIIDAQGSLKRIKTLTRTESPTLIPATEFSAGRTRDISPHPLCEELSYCAPDLPNVDTEKCQQYSNQLTSWCSSEFDHPKAAAVRAYLAKGCLWTDLSAQNVFPLSIEDGQGRKTKIADEKVFVRWRVEVTGDPCSGTWEDENLISAWIAFDRGQNESKGICMVTGESVRIGKKHPRFLRNPSDGAKLISANDDEGYVFRGRFTDGKKEYGRQTCSVGFEVSQKAHSALRWLIQRQGYRNDTQAIVSWAVTGKPIPNWFASTLELCGIAAPNFESGLDSQGVGQSFAIRLRKSIAGYGANLGPTDSIVVMGLDSATTGRMAITYYRELNGSEFLTRIEAWHVKCAWPQNFGKNVRFVGAPAPRDIAEAGYGRWDEKLNKVKVDESLLRTTAERLLPCVLDGRQIPFDLVLSVCHHASNRVGFKRNKEGDEEQWEKCLGIACALFKGSQTERDYQMTLETDRRTRDYLYGRLLAIAERIESVALRVGDEKQRDTSAARMMQRFADRPYSTWRTIELALVPYKTRLRVSRAPFLSKMDKLLDEVMNVFAADDFTQDAPLSGEFLLGYHCQRQALKPSDDAPPAQESATDSVE